MIFDNFVTWKVKPCIINIGLPVNSTNRYMSLDNMSVLELSELDRKWRFYNPNNQTTSLLQFWVKTSVTFLSETNLKKNVITDQESFPTTLENIAHEN